MASETEGIHTDFSEGMSYGDYLGLDHLLSAQTPALERARRASLHHHPSGQGAMAQAFNRELDAAIDISAPTSSSPRSNALARISRIQEQLIQAWTVLSTMTPPDYLSSAPSWAALPASSPGNTA